MAKPALSDKIESLNDIELALLCCITANQSCLLRYPVQALPGVSGEIEKIATKTYGLTCRSLKCMTKTTVADVRHAIIIDEETPRGEEPCDATDEGKTPSATEKKPSSNATSEVGRPRIANVAVLSSLGDASREAQVQVLELVRTRRIPSQGAVLTAPDLFLVVVLDCLESTGRLVSHLMDHLLLSHSEEASSSNQARDEAAGNGQDSLSSSDSSKSGSPEERPASAKATFSSDDLSTLSRLAQSVAIKAEVRRYLQDIVVFLRMHRAVDGGVTARASRDFEQLASCLAALHGLSFVTPSLVALAAPKVYAHRIVLTRPEDERSMQWGSNIHAVTAYLSQLTPAKVVADVLSQVDVPI